MGLIRFFHSTVTCGNVNKSALALLRKKTGFPFANIRKALELNENDVTKAEDWLKEQAKAMGWNKVFKVQDRRATQGLIGIAVERKKLAMVEVNCETDFVARNDKFKSLVELVARTCLQQPVLKSGERSTGKVEYDKTQLENLKSENDTLGDHLAVLVGTIGENMTLKRALCFETTENDVDIAFAMHPPLENSNKLLGKFGAFISYTKTSQFGENSLNVPVEICKHIIGMNPQKIGEVDAKKEGEENALVDVPEKIDVELVKQNFVFDDAVTVGEVLANSGVRILDFNRFQCGELKAPESDTQVKENANVRKASGMS